jgi:DivIVA domain-containing protein
VTTVLQYLVIAAVIGGVIFAIAVFVFGRGEQLAALPPRTSPTELADGGLTGQDVRSVRFPMALRGYRMSDVDWALERLATELDGLRAQLAERAADPDAVTVPADDLARRRVAAGDRSTDSEPDGGDRW